MTVFFFIEIASTGCRVDQAQWEWFAVRHGRDATKHRLLSYAGRSAGNVIPNRCDYAVNHMP